MARYGGVASVGRMWTSDEIIKADDMGYGQKRRSLISGTGATVLTGGGIAALGARNWADSHAEPKNVVARSQAANATHAVNVGRQRRALSEAAHQEAVQQNSRKGLRWLRSGKVRRARTQLELVNREVDRSAAAAATHQANRLPENLTTRSKHLRRGGKVMVAGGLGLAASPLIFNKADDRRRASRDAAVVTGAGLGAAGAGEIMRRTAHRQVSQALVDPVKYEAMTDKKFGQLARRYRAGSSARALGAGAAIGGAAIGLRSMSGKREPVVKTISQARYGGNAEMGRAWRGPEKKDRREPAIALAGGTVGLGGTGAALVGARKLRNVGPEVAPAPKRETKGLKAAHSGALQQAHTAAVARGTSETRLKDTKRLHDTWLMRDKSGIAQEHPFKGHPAPGSAKGQVGPRGGGYEHLERAVEGAHKKTHGEWSAADQKAAAARRAVREAEAHNAGRHAAADAANAGRNATIKGSKRLIRGGSGLAAVGGLTALAAGIKAERDRKTGGRHIRKDSPELMASRKRAYGQYQQYQANRAGLAAAIGSKSNRLGQRYAEQAGTAARNIAAERKVQHGLRGGAPVSHPTYTPPPPPVRPVAAPAAPTPTVRTATGPVKRLPKGKIGLGLGVGGAAVGGGVLANRKRRA